MFCLQAWQLNWREPAAAASAVKQPAANMRPSADVPSPTALGCCKRGPAGSPGCCRWLSASLCSSTAAQLLDRSTHEAYTHSAKALQAEWWCKQLATNHMTSMLHCVQHSLQALIAESCSIWSLLHDHPRGTPNSASHPPRRVHNGSPTDTMPLTRAAPLYMCIHWQLSYQACCAKSCNSSLQ